jgi:hypothetical protein
MSFTDICSAHKKGCNWWSGPWNPTPYISEPLTYNRWQYRMIFNVTRSNLRSWRFFFFFFLYIHIIIMICLLLLILAKTGQAWFHVLLALSPSPGRISRVETCIIIDSAAVYAVVIYMCSRTQHLFPAALDCSTRNCERIISFRYSNRRE